MRSKVEVDEEAREDNIRNILALCTLRSSASRVFFRFALEEMTNQQIAILIQKMGEWMSENPPKKGDG
jgi:hypothetical protein